MKTKRYNVLSPDGISIEFDETYPSIKKAKAAFENWKARYEYQGYYSSNRGRIELEDLESYCKIIVL